MTFRICFLVVILMMIPSLVSSFVPSSPQPKLVMCQRRGQYHQCNAIITRGAVVHHYSSSRLFVSSSTAAAAYNNNSTDGYYNYNSITPEKQHLFNNNEKLHYDDLVSSSSSLQHKQQQQQQVEVTTNKLVSLFINKTNNNKFFNIMNINDVWKARLLLLGASSLYGTNFSFVKILGDTMPVGISSTLRFGFACLVTLPWLFENINENEESSSLSNNIIDVTKSGFEVGIWTSIGYISQAVGLETTDASKSAFICSLAVVIVPILDYFVAGKKLKGQQFIGALLAVLGVACLELGGGMNSSSDGALSFSSGDLASLVQPIAFGIGFWKMEHTMISYPNEAKRTTAAQLLAVFLASALYCFTCEDNSSFNIQQIMTWVSNMNILGSLIWTGIITTALTVWMETEALKTLSAAETTLIFSSEPIFGAACASVVCHEVFGVDALIGATLVLIGCLYSNLDIGNIVNETTNTNANMDDSENNKEEESNNNVVHHQPQKRRTSFLLQSSGFTVGAAREYLSTPLDVAVALETDCNNNYDNVDAIIENAIDNVDQIIETAMITGAASETIF